MKIKSQAAYNCQYFFILDLEIIYGAFIHVNGEMSIDMCD